MSATIALTADNFDDTITGTDKPVLVDFWAGWCGPCRAVGPIVEQLAEEYAETLTVGKVDIDAAPEIAQRFNVMSIPTIILFKNGEPAVTSVGAAPKEELVSRFSEYL